MIYEFYGQEVLCTWATEHHINQASNTSWLLVH